MKAQQYIPILWLRSIKSCFTRIKDLWILFRSGLFNEESCFPELPRKNKFQRAIQLIWYLLRYGEIMWQYNLYGLDVKPFKAMKEYIGNKELMWREYKYNVLMAKEDYTNILKDKRLFYLYLTDESILSAGVFPILEKRERHYRSRIFSVEKVTTFVNHSMGFVAEAFSF